VAFLRLNTLSIDGHDFSQILEAIDSAKRVTDRPTAIVAKTIKARVSPS